MAGREERSVWTAGDCWGGGEVGQEGGGEGVVSLGRRPGSSSKDFGEGGSAGGGGGDGVAGEHSGVGVPVAMSEKKEMKRELGPGDRFVGVITHSKWSCGTNPLKINGYFFVQGEGLPQDGLYCPANEYREKLVHWLGGTAAAQDGKSTGQALKETKSLLQRCVDRHVSGDLVLSAKGTRGGNDAPRLEGRNLRFDSMFELATPEIRNNLDAVAHLRDLFFSTPASATLHHDCSPTPALARGPSRGQGSGAQPSAAAVPHGRVSPASHGGGTRLEGLDVEKAEECVALLVRQHLLQHPEKAATVSALAGKINSLYTNQNGKDRAVTDRKRLVRTCCLVLTPCVADT